ncbi:winged helix-turn-helix domain-containing protein [Microbulbifer aggregans]|uniref:winged helix-turn-helix domain-containing protein n=1 Tax=Microbulbifer aggregans TaxID=1769779 RepID=UPI001CFE652F|nr:winged helix-turn-helix domain-containing protein [Microbulbifer aggregans]
MTSNVEYDIGCVRVNLEEQSVSHGEQRLELSQKKYFDVLQCLVEQYPNWVTREQLIELVWGGNHFVGDKAINNAIWHIRKALAEVDPDVQYVVTKRGHGYRLAVEPVQRVPEANSEQGRSLPATRWLGLGLSVAVLFPMAWFAVQALVAGSPPVNTVSSITRLTNYPGSEFTPIVDFDRNWVAFTWARPNQSPDLYIRPLKSDAPPKQLTFTEQSEYGPVWAADGAGLYYVERDKSQHTCAVKHLDLATLTRKPITDCYYDLNTHLAIHPSGSPLAVNKIGPGIQNSGVYLVDLDDSDVFSAADAEGLPETRLSCGDECRYADRDMAFSNDGSRIALTRRTDLLSENIFVRDLATGEEQQLTSAESDIKGLAWSRKDDRIVYASEVAGKRVTQMVDLQSGKIAPLALPGISSINPVPGSDAFVFGAGNTDTYISYLDLEGDLKAAIPLLQANFDQGNAHYSTQHQKLVYCSNESGAMELWVSNLDGSQRERLTNLKSEVKMPRWSNNGERIAFIAADSSAAGSQLLVIDFATREVQKVQPKHHDYRRPVWSEDDSHLYAAVSDGQGYQTYQFDLDAGTGLPIADMPVLKLRPIGKGEVLFTQAVGSGLWRAEIDPSVPELKNPREILPGDQFSPLYNWDAHRDQVYFHLNADLHSKVMKLNLSTGEISGLALLPRDSLDKFGEFSYIPEKNWLLFTQMEPYQSDIYQFQLND